MKLKPIVIFTLFITVFGCAPYPNTEETQPFPTSTMIQPTPTHTLVLPTPTPATKLQLTYVQLKEGQKITKFYAIDITCINADKICFGEPKLLFQSLKSSNSDRGLPKGFIADYSWSPDGNKIVLESATDILIGDISAWEWSNITKTPEAEHTPKWSSDGKSIYYIACIEDPSGMCTPQLIRYDLAGKQKLQLLQAWNQSFSSDYAISPDGQKIIFSILSHLSLNDVLYLANWDGTDSHQITTLHADETGPSFSPDGQKIVFVRSTLPPSLDSKKESDILVKDLTSGEERNLTENFDGLASWPFFSPDGKWIVFHAFDDVLNINVYLVSIENGNIIQVTEDNDSGFPVWRIFSE